jgi:hypothetical protein
MSLAFCLINGYFFQFVFLFLLLFVTYINLSSTFLFIFIYIHLDLNNSYFDLNFNNNNQCYHVIMLLSKSDPDIFHFFPYTFYFCSSFTSPQTFNTFVFRYMSNKFFVAMRSVVAPGYFKVMSFLFASCSVKPYICSLIFL